MDWNDQVQETESFEQIAVIGMAASFPGSNSVDKFWTSLCEGKDGVLNYTDDELKHVGVPEEWLRDPAYVKVGTRLDHFDEFDARFFGYNRREAFFTDPQQRLFLEKSWEALEHAGYTSDSAGGLIGVFAGASPSYYRELLPRLDVHRDVIGRMELMIGNELDYLATRVSYKLNLKGPSLTTQTACSASLTAVHLACQSLLTYQCSMALAGGVSINISRPWGYFYKEGSILSPDGKCRAFDAKANGTVVGQGVGVVVLKRLSEALADNDTVYAVIKGSGINNDGSVKMGFTAPSVEGQAEAISLAHGLSDVTADSITYVEAHGTGTKLGDPVEVAALTKAFRTTTDKIGYCALGSVKTNIGHADAAAGIAGLIKTVLMLRHGKIPPSLHYQIPNPEIDFANSPFFVSTLLEDWSRNGFPRRAGVSSFGVGGTNVHMVLEEAPDLSPSCPSRSHQLILLSGRSPSALKSAAKNLAEHLEKSSLISMPDVAYTLNMGRKCFDHRQILVCQGKDDAVEILKDSGSFSNFKGMRHPGVLSTVFMFSGQGTQYANMGKDLYKSEPTFKDVFDTCAEILRPILPVDLRRLIYPEKGEDGKNADRINHTALAQPALFVIEYALAKLWESWGVSPQAMIGHSIGEYVAACLAGVFDLESALSIVAARGRLMQEMPPGAMIAVAAPETDVERYLDDQLALAAVNAPGMCVFSGEFSAVESLERRLDHEKIIHRRLITSHAFHSPMMETAARRLAKALTGYEFHRPRIPFLSNSSGTWITDEEATSPGYWVSHLCRPVRFSQCLVNLLKQKDQVLLEIGPGNTLCTLARQHTELVEGLSILPSLRHPKENRSDVEYILTTLGRLWIAGVNAYWSGFYANEQRKRIPLPTYPFERERIWPDKKTLDQPPQQEMTPSVSFRREKNDSDFAETSDIITRDIKFPKFETDAEKSLARIWHELLLMPDVGPTDNYFELGGSSILAARMFGQIERRFDKRLPLSTLYEAPTIRELAARITDEDFTPSWECLVEIQKGGSKPILFLMHSHGGNVLEYYRLSYHLGQEQPIYALQAKGLDGNIIKKPTIKSMVSEYIKEIKRIQPHGPYYIGGFCLGGLLAIEAAQTLTSQGEEIALLILIHASTPDYHLKRPPGQNIINRNYNKFKYRVELEYSNLAALSKKGKLLYFFQRVRKLKGLLRAKIEMFTEILLRNINVNMKKHSIAYNLQSLAEAHLYAVNRYQLTPYDGDVVCINAINRPKNKVVDPYLGLKEYLTGNKIIYEVPGFQQNILNEPNVEAVAQKIRYCLKQTQSGKTIRPAA